jgi:hypothetical protein
LAEIIISASRKNLEIKHIISKKGDIIHIQAGTSLERNNLEYNPKFKLREEVE